jgi:ABC-type multidrug transport system fused ATPase/permease subunit
VIAVLALATFARAYLVTWLGERVVTDLRARVYGRVIGLSPAFFETTRTGEVLARLTSDTAVVQAVISASLSQALRNVLLLIGGLVLLIVSNPKLSGLVLIVVPLVVVPIVVIGRRVRRLSRTAQDRSDAELAGGKVGLEVVEHAERQARGAAALLGPALHAKAAGPHESELSGDKVRVCGQQQHHGDRVESHGHHGGHPCPGRPPDRGRRRVRQ